MSASDPCRRGFSLVEILVIVAVIGVVSTVAIPLVTGVPEAAKKEKLEQDVVIVNNAIDSYLASGGDPTNLTSASVITALKSRVYGGVAAEMMGPRGPFLDPTVVTNPTDFEWSAVFTTDPRPRFVLVQGTEGVVFGTGAAAEIGGVAQRADEGRTSWLWSYADTAATVAAADIFRPSTVAESPSTFSPTNLSRLQPPTFEPPGGTFPLADFGAMNVELRDPNAAGSSRIFFSTDDQGASWSVYGTPLSVAPGKVWGRAVSLDPSRYANSATNTETYKGQPVLTWSSANTEVTYFEVISGVSGLSATPDAEVPGIFEVRYTAGGVTSNALTLPHPTNWVGATLDITAQAIITNDSEYYVDSEPTNSLLIASSEDLGTPSMSPPGEYVFGSKVVTFEAASGSPDDVRFFYTTNSGTVLSPESGTEGDFVVISGLLADQRVTNRLIAAAPAGLEDWFNTSGEVAEVYLAPNFNFNEAGLLVVGGNIGNAEVIGSIILVSPDGTVPPTITFANNASLDGDIYAPGTPNVYVSKKPIASARVTDLDGPEEPVYDIYVDKVDWNGNVFRRITPVTVPPVSLPAGLEIQEPVTSAAPPGFLLPPGYYSSVALANNQVIKLGVEGATDPVVYQFDDFSLGNGVVVEVVGPVILTLNPGANQDIDIGNNTALSVGNSEHPEWLQIKMYTGNLNLGNKASLYASILNPNGAVSLGESSTFRGSVTARSLTVDNSATVTFDIPPPTL